jgi:anaerobic selenocysteine-containing dehydrogenase
MTCLSNPVYSDPAGKRIEEILKDEKHIPFYAAVDTHITETTALADLVLPAATCFESWGLDSREPIDMTPYIGLRQPVVRPMGEALSFSSVLAEIAKGIGQDVPYDDAGYIGSCLEKIKGLSANDEVMRLRKKGFWSSPDFKPGYRCYADGGFRTPSGKMELYSTELQKEGLSPLPFYRVRNEDADPTKGKLFLTTFKAGASASLNPNSKWLSEIFHENPLWINEVTAGKLGLADGQKVEIYSGNGNAVVTVRLTQAIHPEVLSIARDLGHWECGRFAMSKKSKSPDPDMSLIWWGDEKSFYISRVLTGESDRVSGGRGLMDTLVSIKKIG